MDVQICGNVAIFLFSSEFDLHSHHVLILPDGHIDIVVVVVSVFNSRHANACTRKLSNEYHWKVISDLVDGIVVDAVLHGDTRLAGEEVAVQFDLAIVCNVQV